VFQFGLTLVTSPLICAEIHSGERQLLIKSRFHALRPLVCECIRRAWESPLVAGKRMLRSKPGQASPFQSTRLCDEARIMLIELLIPPCLELSYCVCPEVADLGRDLFMDLVAAELGTSEPLAAVRVVPRVCCGCWTCYGW
jgi:hypothetical protein